MKIVGFAGSLNKESRTEKALWVALEAARQAGAEIVMFNLREHPLPIYDPSDDSKWELENVKYFMNLFKEADGFIMGSPEYHNGITGAWKNAVDFLGFDWFAGKPVGLVASAGGPVAVNTMNMMATILRSLHAYVIPQNAAIGRGIDVGEDGKFADEKMQERFEKVGLDVVKLAKAIR